MKRIREFLEGKVRRSETGDLLTISTEGEPHPELGALEGRLSSAAGALAFHERGLVLASGAAVPYASLARVEVAPPHLELTLEDGGVHRLTSSAAGALVVHATLRWIGNTILRRRIGG